MADNVTSIDINCDMGEGSLNGEAIFPLITSCNISCGFHAGSPIDIERTLKAAIEYGVGIGAHPSYPDRENFGRMEMKLPPEELKATLRYQLGALMGMTKALGGKVTYVKPHGALYNTVADNADEAAIIIEIIRSMDEELAVMGLPGSVLEEKAKAVGVKFIAEAFADRRYQDNGRLVPRSTDRALIEDPQEAAAQVLSIIMNKQLTSIDGNVVPVIAQSICVHGDHPQTPLVLKAIHDALMLNNIEKMTAVTTKA